MAASSVGHFLVTGANKGIGLAIVKSLLKNGASSVFLGSRDVGRGTAARASIAEQDQPRVTVVQLDVTDKNSISKAVASVKETLGDDVLQGVINNAGGLPSGGGFGWTGVADFDWTMALNYGGVFNVTNAFIPLLNADGGRVVNISSGAASMFLQKCSPEKQAVFINPDVSLEDVAAFFTEMKKIGGAVNKDGDESKNAETEAAFQAAGYATSTYGASKVALNALTMVFARKYPKLKINSCSPGFIATDLVADLAKKRGTTAEAMGAVSVDKGAICPTFLAIGNVPTPPGVGYYYGSDAKRSPLHKYRSPGSPAYTGEEEEQPAAPKEGGEKEKTAEEEEAK